MVFSKSSGCHRLERPWQGALSALSSSPHLLPLCLLSPSDFSSQSIVAGAGEIHAEVAFNLIRDWFSQQLICVAASIRVPPLPVPLLGWGGGQEPGGRLSREPRSSVPCRRATEWCQWLRPACEAKGWKWEPRDMRHWAEGWLGYTCGFPSTPCPLSPNAWPLVAPAQRRAALAHPCFAQGMAGWWLGGQEGI